MAHKKLLIKKSKSGKLKVHKNKSPAETGEEVMEDSYEEEESEADDDGLEEIETEVGTMLPIEGHCAIGDEEFVEKLGEVLAKNHMANVGYQCSRTVNLGDYESLKFSVDIHVPSEVDEDEIDANFDFCREWSESKLEAIMVEYMEEDDDE